jgi:hypothetical protein
MDPDVRDFDRYEEFFREDSVVELAQTGAYRGPADIREYVSFLFPTSPFFTTEPQDYSDKRRLLSFDQETGECRFIDATFTRYNLDPAFTSGATVVDLVVMGTVYLNLRERKITRGNVFYTADFLNFLFGNALNTDETRRFLCSLLNGKCQSVLGTSGTQCTTTDLAALDAAAGELAWVDGNSQGCRILHGAFADTNPELHCAHISLTEAADPTGRVKCQVSAGRQLSEMFSTEELEFYDDFAASVGIDPTAGYEVG